MKRNRFIAFVFLFALLAGMSACTRTHPAFRQKYEPLKNALRVFTDNGRTIGYMRMMRSDTLPTIFFLHGSPDDLNVYRTYYEDTSLVKWANIIAADRPGYGLSEAGKPEISVRKQAELMWKILEREGYPSPLYILGSSYGGTVAARMAMMKPDKLDGLVLLSASLAPGLETTYDISYLIRYRVFKKLLPYKINVANDEKLAHYESLNEMAGEWTEIKVPVIMFQGARDRLIYPGIVSFARNNLVNAPYIEIHMCENERHCVKFKYKNLILGRLKRLIDLTGSDPNSLTGIVEFSESELNAEY